MSSRRAQRRNEPPEPYRRLTPLEQLNHFWRFQTMQYDATHGILVWYCFESV